MLHIVASNIKHINNKDKLERIFMLHKNLFQTLNLWIEGKGSVNCKNAHIFSARSSEEEAQNIDLPPQFLYNLSLKWLEMDVFGYITDLHLSTILRWFHLL